MPIPTSGFASIDAATGKVLTSQITVGAATGANSDITSMSGLTGDVGKPSSVTLANGGALRTDTTAGNTLLLQAYDTDTGPAYVTFGTLTAGTTPTFDLSDAVTKASNYIYRASGTDVAVADGGTGASTAELARFNLGAVGILSTTNNIDGKSVANTNIYTVPNGKTAIFTGCIVRLTTIVGMVTGGTANVANSTSFATIFGSQALTNLSTTNIYFNYAAANTTISNGVAGDVIQFQVSVGYNATTATLSVDLLGYLL